MEPYTSSAKYVLAFVFVAAYYKLMSRVTVGSCTMKKKNILEVEQEDTKNYYSAFSNTEMLTAYNMWQTDNAEKTKSRITFIYLNLN